MIDENKLGHLRSRLPEDQAYWDGLADRISARSAGQIEEFGKQSNPWWIWLADFAPALAVAALLVVAGTWAFAPPPPSASAEAPRGLGQLVAPDEPLARAFLSDSEPPALAALSWPGANEEGNR